MSGLPARVRPVRSGRRRALIAAVSACLPVAALLTVVTVSSGTAAADAPAPPSGWTTVFSDDFDGAAGTPLDSSDWIYDTGTGYSGGAADWGTGEVETMTNSTQNVYEDGQGHLVIKAIDDNGQWSSGRVETQRTDFGAPAGGEMEMTASVEQPDPASGVGYWPAFWALGAAARPVGATNWPSIGELDIMEDVNGLSEVSHTFHCGVDPGGPCDETTGLGSGLLACPGCQTGYHTYSVIVDRTNTSAEQLRFYTDGALQFTVNQSQVDATTWANAVDHGFFGIFDLAVGGAYPNAICGCSSPTSATSTTASMSVDYFAVYESGGGGGSSTSPSSCGTTATASISADCYSGSAGSIDVSPTTDSSPSGVDGNQVAQLVDGDYLEYPNIQFGSGGSSQFDARVASGAASGVSGLVNVVLDNPSNAPIGSFAVANTGGWSSWKTVPANITATTGTHTVFLEFSSAAGGSPPYVSLHYFSFPTS